VYNAGHLTLENFTLGSTMYYLILGRFSLRSGNCVFG